MKNKHLAAIFVSVLVIFLLQNQAEVSTPEVVLLAALGGLLVLGVFPSK